MPGMSNKDIQGFPGITFECLNDCDIEQCRELFQELMAFQKSKARIHPEWFDSMNFETRMKKVHENALEKQVIVARDNGEPAAYVFTTVDNVEEAHRKRFPDWASSASGTGFFPDWLELPQKTGCLRNLYLREKYRGLGIGSMLSDMAMGWVECFDDVNITFVYISNGNDDARMFYEKQGFTFSHDVFDGFITALFRRSP